MQGTSNDACAGFAGGATLTGYTQSQVAPLTVATPAVCQILSVGCPKGRVLGGIGGRNGNFFQKGGSVGIFIKIRDGLVKKSKKEDLQTIIHIRRKKI
jgi:hypothetical protein